MQIIAYHKKKKSWLLCLNEEGAIQTGKQHGWNRGGSSRIHECEVPIFRAKLKYCGHRQGTKSIMVEFRGDEADSLIAVLKGTGPCKYDMDKDDGFTTMEHLILRDDPFYEYFDDGWFEGTFTFKNKGDRVYITPFRGDINNEKSI